MSRYSFPGLTYSYPVLDERIFVPVPHPYSPELYFRHQARRAQRDSDDSEEEAEEDEEEDDIEALLDAEEEEEEEMEEEEEESEEDAIERLKTEIGDRYDEETGRVATVQVSDGLISF